VPTPLVWRLRAKSGTLVASAANESNKFVFRCRTSYVEVRLYSQNALDLIEGCILLQEQLTKLSNPANIACVMSKQL
jgi:hypothetical protein